MAHASKAVAANVPGRFYVDSSCIDCGTCRWMAPAVFGPAGGTSRVHHQPEREEQSGLSWLALTACPTGSIGARGEKRPKDLEQAFPRPFAPDVLHCGYHARDSFGAASWLILRPDGNVLIDSPRFTTPLVERIEALGGIATIFLTHKDDVADHDRFARHFGAIRVMHQDDLTARTRMIERPIAGREPVPLAPDLLVIPVPGHTRGSACLLHKDVLFTGDHLAWSLAERRLVAFDDVCWYDWQEQVASMRRLAGFGFSWVLPGHGAPIHLPADEMKRAMIDLNERLNG